MHLHIISWNVWGINDFRKRQFIKAALRRWKSHVICFQETKMGAIHRRVVSSLGGGRWFDWDFLGAVVSAGGILVMWDKRVVSRMDVVMGNHSVSCLMKSVENDKLWIFSGVYGPCADNLRFNLWEELKAIRLKWNVPWCIG